MDNARFTDTQKQSAHSRRFFLFLFLLCCVGVFVYVAVWAWHIAHTSDAFPIKNIEVRGKLIHLQKDDIARQVETNLHGGFFALSLLNLADQLSKNPWIAQTTFQRLWPDTLIVSVTEKKAIARWNDKGVVAQTGDVFYPNVDTLPTNVPVFYAPDDQLQTVLQEFQEITTLLNPLSLTVKQLTLSNQGSWQMMLNNGMAIQLGDQDVMDRLERFVRVFRKMQALSSHPVASVDLRYPNGFSVGYRAPL